MKWWMKFSAAFLAAAAIVVTLFLFVSAERPYSKAEQAAAEKVRSENLLAAIDEAYVYNSTDQLVTVIGTDSEGIRKAVFMPEEGNPVHFTLEGAVTADEAEKTATEETEASKILHTRLGLEDGNPVWEVAFIGQEDRLNYVYISAEDGTWRKRILNL